MRKTQNPKALRFKSTSIVSLGPLLSFFILCAITTVASAQFTVERSPWLDSKAVTDDPINQTWIVKDAISNRSMKVELTVEGLNPRKPVHLLIQDDKLLQLQPQRRYTRICVEPEYMMYSDRIFANPEIERDTMRLDPISVGLAVELEPIVFYPGTNEFFFSSIPTLEALLSFVEVNPTLDIAIQSAQCFDPGSGDSEMDSRDRARAVFEYLVSSGINPNRLAVESTDEVSGNSKAPATIEEAEATQRITVRVTNY